MRWALLAIVGALFVGVGAVDLGAELAQGKDIWRRWSALALLVPGAWMVWKGLSERASGPDTGKPILPAVIWAVVLIAIGIGLFLWIPPLAILFAVAVMAVAWASGVARE